jgi:hypothetical protein
MLYIALPASPSLSETKTLVFDATIHFVRHSFLVLAVCFVLNSLLCFY